MPGDRNVLLLGLSTACEYALQLTLPVILVRLLSTEEFGEYRLYWLIAQTAALVVSFNVANSLVYQVSQHVRKGALVANAFAFLFVGAVLVGSVVFAGAELDLDVFAQMRSAPWMLAAFCAFWVASLPFDTIPLASGHPQRQALFAVTQGVARTLIICIFALVGGTIVAVALGLVSFAALRLLVALVYSLRSSLLHPVLPDRSIAVGQARYALAFGLGSTLFLLRNQVDGWVAAALFDQTALAVIAVAFALIPIFGIVRQAYTNAMIPKLAASAAGSQQQQRDAFQLNAETNSRVSLFVVPAAFFLFLIAPYLIPLLFTDKFADAVTPFRIYLLSLPAIACIESSTLIQAFGHGAFQLAQAIAILLLTAPLAFVLGRLWGVSGIALASSVILIGGALANLLYLARRHDKTFRTLQDWRFLILILLLTAVATLLAKAATASLSADGPRIAAFEAVAFGTVFLLIAATSSTLRRRYVGAIGDLVRR